MFTRASFLIVLVLSLPAPAASLPLAPEVEKIRSAIRAGDIDAAVEASDSATEQRPNDALAWMWAGRAYLRRALAASLLGKPRWAVRTRDAWETAVTLDPRLVDARFNLMEYYLQAPGILGGDRDKAAIEARIIAGIDESIGKLAAGVIAQIATDDAGAEAAFRESLALDPANHRARMALSGLLQRLERGEEAFRLWRERLDAAPEDAVARFQFARLAASRGEQLEYGLQNIEAFIATVEIPDNMSLNEAHWHRGRLLEKLGRLDEARSAYEIAQTDASIGEFALADLERIRRH